MPTLPPKLTWYVNRLRSMPPAEIPHRLREQVHKRLDRRGVAARKAGALPLEAAEAPLVGLPIDRALLQESLAGERARLRRLCDAMLAGELTLLGQAWPSGARRAWDLDPSSGGRWPMDRGCHDIPYRHESGPGDVKFVWELNRLQHLVVLALGAFAFDDAAARRAVFDDLGAWIDENPPYKGVSWACGIELASRVVSMLAIMGLLGPQTFPAPLVEAIHRSLYAHGLFMARYPSLYSSANNHRIAEAAALFLLGTLAPHLPDASRWEEEGRAALEQEVLLQIFPDGVGGEQAPTYQAYTLEWYALARRVALHAGRPLSSATDERLVAALVHLAAITDRSGQVPHIGDDDGAVVLRTSWDRAEDVGSVATALAAMLGRPELLPPGARADARSGLLGVRVPAQDWRPPAGRSFPEGGYTALRHVSGPHELLAVLDHGPLGFGPIAAHGHADALSLCLHVDGIPLLVDPGAYRYNHSKGWRDYLRSTLAHNTVEVGGESQSVSTGAFNWGARAVAVREALSLGAELSHVAASHDGYRARFGVLHRRAVSLRGVSELTVRDELLGVSARPVRLVWHFGPDLEVVPDGSGRGWRVSRAGALLFELRVEGPALSASLHRQVERPGPGALSPAYNVLIPAFSLVLEGTPKLPASWVWTFRLPR